MRDAQASGKILYFSTSYRGDRPDGPTCDPTDYITARARVGLVRSVARANPHWDMFRLRQLDAYLTGAFDGAELAGDVKAEFDKCRSDWALLSSLYPSHLLTELAAQADYEDISAPLPSNVCCLFEQRERRALNSSR